MHEVLVNRLGGLSLPRKSVVRLTDRPDMTLDVYRGRKTTKQQQQQPIALRGPASFPMNCRYNVCSDQPAGRSRHLFILHNAYTIGKCWFDEADAKADLSEFIRKDFSRGIWSHLYKN